MRCSLQKEPDTNPLPEFVKQDTPYPPSVIEYVAKATESRREKACHTRHVPHGGSKIIGRGTHEVKLTLGRPLEPGLATSRQVVYDAERVILA